LDQIRLSFIEKVSTFATLAGTISISVFPISLVLVLDVICRAGIKRVIVVKSM
jgi:hypothetical protein